MAVPAPALQGKRQDPDTQVRSWVQLLKSNLQGATFRTLRLFVCSNPGDFELLRDRLAQHFLCYGSLFLRHPQLYASHGVRPEPVHSADVLIPQSALDARRIQASLR